MVEKMASSAGRGYLFYTEVRGVPESPLIGRVLLWLVALLEKTYVSWEGMRHTHSCRPTMTRTKFNVPGSNPIEPVPFLCVPARLQRDEPSG